MSANSVRVMVGLASPPLEVDAWLAIGRRPLGRRLSPRAPLRVRPRRRDRAEHEACLPLRELHAQALLPMLPPHHLEVQVLLVPQLTTYRSKLDPRERVPSK